MNTEPSFLAIPDLHLHSDNYIFMYIICFFSLVYAYIIKNDILQRLTLPFSAGMIFCTHLGLHFPSNDSVVPHDRVSVLWYAMGLAH